MQRWMIWMFVTVVTVLAWSVVMAAVGQAAAVMTLAPALGLLVQQITAAVRHQATRAPKAATEPPEPVDLVRAAADIAAVVYVHHGRFRRRHPLAEARRHLAGTLAGLRAEPGLDERIVAAALEAHCRALTAPAGPLAGEHTAYTLTLADQLPRRPPAGTRIAASRHEWARIASLSLRGITTGEPAYGRRSVAFPRQRQPPRGAGPLPARPQTPITAPDTGPAGRRSPRGGAGTSAAR